MWERWSTGNCARNWNLTIRAISIWITQNLSWRLRRTNSSGILIYKRISDRRPDHILISVLIIINSKKKKKRTCRIVDFAVPADHRVKLKQNEKKDKYIDLASELTKLWNRKVTIIPTLIDALDTVTKGLIKGRDDMEIKEREEIIQSTALLRSARILRKFLGDLRRLVVIQTPVKDHQLTLMWKTLKE